MYVEFVDVKFKVDNSINNYTFYNNYQSGKFSRNIFMVAKFEFNLI